MPPTDEFRWAAQSYRYTHPDGEDTMSRKINASLFISLDGVVEAPDQWHFPYFNDEMGAAVGASLSTTEVMLFGRVTYDSFAGAWPGREAAGATTRASPSSSATCGRSCSPADVPTSSGGTPSRRTVTSPRSPPR
ncbi:hypothetical protein SHKM778_44340 [Streptomyces sp. KM77-8]|uniref:Pyrimidine reductase n=1 Tax=Streptomyces haneummycinicus TaxID=3074435 RepID=A0AAT9HLC9_9ACTN